MKLQIKLPMVLLIIIVLGAFILRVVDLQNTPSGLHADEASFLINAESILKTGRDEDGRIYPLTLNSLIDPKPALYSYAQIPFIWLFESSTFSSRLPSAIAGTASVALFFILIRKLTYNNVVALLSATVLSLSPWHIVLSRASQEVIFSSFFVLLASIFFIRFLNTSKRVDIFYFFLTSFLAMYCYHSSKVFLLLFTTVISLFLLKYKIINVKKSAVIMIVACIALVFSLSVQESSSRFSAVGVLNNPEPQLQLDLHIREATGAAPAEVLRIFYNKPVFYSKAVFSEYIQHFSPNFLFLEGGQPLRYFIPNHGLLYWIELPLLLLGIILVLRSRKKVGLIFFGWLLIAPIAAALTYQETPSSVRAFLMVFPLSYLIAEGLLFVLRGKKFIILMPIVICAAYVWSVSYFWMQFAVQQKVMMPWYRNNPYMDIAQSVSKISGNYDEVVITNDLRPLYAYFVLENLISNEQLQSQPNARNLSEYSLGKYFFNQGICDFGVFRPNVLYISEVQCRINLGYPDYLHVVSTIHYNDGLPVYELLELRN